MKKRVFKTISEIYRYTPLFLILLILLCLFITINYSVASSKIDLRELRGMYHY